MSKKKTIEFNFVTFIIILAILFGIVFMIARKTGTNIINIPDNNQEQIAEKEGEKEYIPYSKNVITIDKGKMTSNWEIIDKEYGSIVFYIQGPKKENEDGTFNDIRINFYIEKSEQTNEELKNQMLNHSIYQQIEYTKMQQINDLQWMEFEAQNKGVKAKIIAIMKDGYMFAVEINGEENLYNEYYNEAMKIVITTQISERINESTAYDVIYKYDNIANIKAGGTMYLLRSLNLPENVEKTEENSTLPEEYKDYIWTGIKYEDFANEMKKYMTEEMLKSQFSEFVNYKDALIVKETTGNQEEYMIEQVTAIEIKGNETTYEVVKTRMSTFETIRENITLKLDGDKCVVSGI